MDVLRVLVLVLVWTIPAILVFLVAVFAILSPVFIWAGVVSGLFQVIRDSLRRRATVLRRKAIRVAKEPVIREVT